MNSRSHSIYRSLFLPVLLLGSASCAMDAVTGEPRYALVQWTPEEEREMGAKSAPDVEAEFGAIHADRESNAVLRALATEMVDLSPRRSELDFSFKILNSSIPNALALPGGHMYITRGLLQELETESQFIAVMGHELGHVEHRHAMLNQSHGALLRLPAVPFRVLANILPIGDRVMGGAAAIIAAPSVLVGLKFSRDQELEADERGVYFAATLGYNPHDAKRTYELFERLERDTPKSWADKSIFRTHPQNEDRIRVIAASIEEQFPELVDRPDDSYRANSPAFEAVLTRMRENAQAYALYDEAAAGLAAVESESAREKLKLVREARDLLPTEPLFHILEGELLLFSEEVPQALTQFKLAVELYARLSPGEEHWKPRMYLGAFALQEGRSHAAVVHLRRACELFPMNGEGHLLLGMALTATGDKQAAERELRLAMQRLPKGSDGYELARERLNAL